MKPAFSSLRFPFVTFAALFSVGAVTAETLVPSFDSVGRASTATDIDKTYAGNLAVGPISGTDYFRSYLTFDLSGATVATGETTLTFAASGFGAGENENNTSSVPQAFTLFSLAADWDGATQPGPEGTILATVNFTPTTGNDNQALSFSSAALTTAFNSALGGNLYLGIKSDAEGTAARSFKWLGSSEDAGFAPQLIYVVDGGSGGDTFAITDIVYSPESNEVTLTWPKTRATSYIVKVSTDMIDWEMDIDDDVTEAEDENPADDTQITVTLVLTGGNQDLNKLFFRVEEQ